MKWYKTAFSYTPMRYSSRRSRSPWAPNALKITASARRMAPVALQFIILVTHRVDHVIDRDAKAEIGVLDGIDGIVGVLPGVAEVHVMAHRDHDAAVVVEDRAPVRLLAGLALFVRLAGFERGHPGDLHALVEIVDRVKNRVVIGKV